MAGECGAYFFVSMRWGAFIFYFIFGGIALHDWRYIRNATVPSSFPWKDDVMTGLAVLAFVGVLGGIYHTFAALAPTRLVKLSWALFHTTVDALIFALLIYGLTRQIKYLPSSTKSCKVSKTYETIDGIPSVFNYTKIALKQDPEDTCKYWINGWRLALGMTVTTGVLVISEIIFCLGLPKDDIKHHFRSCFPSAAFDLLSSRLGRFGRRIWSVISWPIAKLIPLGKFTLAYLRKQKQRRSNAMELRKRGQSRSSTAISLQDQSKSAKHACLKVNENANLFQAFSTSECWGCTNTICNSCRHQFLATPTELKHHLHHEPNCSSCYLRLLRTAESSGNGICKCSPEDIVRNDYVCANCIAKPYNAVKETKETLEREGLASMPDKCKGCEKALGTQTVWWLCRYCGGECTNSCHPAYVEKNEVQNIV